MISINTIINKIKGHENARLISYETISKENFRDSMAYEELKDKKITGVPICFYRKKEDGKLYTVFEDNSHVLIVGATGSGKTTGYIIILLNIIAEIQNSSCVINDPKGELYSMLGKKFMDSGYKVFNLNFRNPTKGDYWNPLTKIFRLYQKAKSVKDWVGICKKKEKNYNTFMGKTYTSQRELDLDIINEETKLMSEVGNEISSITKYFIKVDNIQQPDWQRSARNIFKAIIYAMLEDSEKCNEDGQIITEDNFSIKTLIEIYDSFGEDSEANFIDNGYFRNRSHNAMSYRLVKSQLLENAPNTRRGVIFTFEAALENCRNSAITCLMCTNTFEIEKFDEEKTAVFIQYSDERDENYDIIELFMMDLYSRLVKVAEGKNGRLNWPFYFVWDEFGNFPAVPRFSNMMTACRSRNMWLILVLQDYAQLDSIYGAQNAAAIRNNANIRMFYGTNDVSTMHAFSAECLNNTQLSPLCALNGIGEKVENFNFETVPLVTVSDLNIIEEGVCYVKCFRKNPMKSWFERSYNCPEFNYKKMSDNETQSIKLSDPKYTFKIITQKRKSRFDF